MAQQNPSYIAGADIKPAVFVKLSGVADHEVIPCVAGDVALGVSSEATREAPIPGIVPWAALDEEPIHVYGADEPCEVVAGAAITAGQRLKPDVNGHAVPATDTEAASAIARSGAALGEKVKITITGLPAATQAVAAVVAAGSVQGDAAALTANATNTVSGADGIKGVVLPAAVAGAWVKVYNEDAAAGLKIYPAVGDDINDGAADAPITIEGKTVATFTALDGSTWAAQFTANV